MMKKRISAFILSALILGQGFTVNAFASERKVITHNIGDTIDEELKRSGVNNPLAVTRMALVGFGLKKVTVIETETLPTVVNKNCTRDYTRYSDKQGNYKVYGNANVESETTVGAETPVTKGEQRVKYSAEVGGEKNGSNSYSYTKSGKENFTLYTTVTKTTTTTKTYLGGRVIREEGPYIKINNVDHQEVITDYK